jgi:DNA-directed RNA polymerase subunit RPC12/RpoP
MFNDSHAESLLRRGIIEARAGIKTTARRYLEQALLVDPGDLDIQIQANLWLSKIEDDPVQKRELLEKVLAVNATHAEARRMLAILDGRLKPDEIVNPDALPARTAGTTGVEADRFMCPNCGARMVFAPDGQTLICEHCTSGQMLGTTGGEAAEQDFFVAMATTKGHSQPVATQVFSCQGCGAEFVLPPGTLSATCAYCTSPYVIKLEKMRDLLPPEGILPHQFTRRQVTQKLIEWVEGNLIAPQGKVDPPRGLYMPVWTFDLAGQIDCIGEIYESEEQNSPLRQQPVVRRVEEAYPVHVDDFLVPASKKLTPLVGRLLGMYGLRAVKPYDPRYLSDWPVDVYDVTMADASLEARSRTYERYKRIARENFHALSNLRTSSANLSITSFKLILLPLWMTNIPLGEQVHPWLLNGQTGQVEAKSLSKAARKARQKPGNGLVNWLGELFDDD